MNTSVINFTIFIEQSVRQPQVANLKQGPEAGRRNLLSSCPHVTA